MFGIPLGGWALIACGVVAIAVTGWHFFGGRRPR
jgi:hypothetical protein